MTYILLVIYWKNHNLSKRHFCMKNQSESNPIRTEIPHLNYQDNLQFYSKLLLYVSESFWGKTLPDESFQYYLNTRDNVLDRNMTPEEMSINLKKSLHGKVLTALHGKKVENLELAISQSVLKILISGEDSNHPISPRGILWSIVMGRKMTFPEDVYFFLKRIICYLDDDFENVRFKSTMMTGLNILEADFQKILKPHHNFISIPIGEDQWFDSDNRSLLHYIQSSIDEIRHHRDDISALCRRQRYAFMVLQRIYRELEYATNEQINLHNRIALWVKDQKKQKRHNTDKSTHNVIDSDSAKLDVFVDTEIDINQEKATEYLDQCFVRIRNVRENIQAWRSKIGRAIRGGNNFLGEFQIMKERLNIIQSKNPRLSEACLYISEKIEEISGMASARIEQQIHENVTHSILWKSETDDKENEIVLGLSNDTQRSIRCVDRYIRHLSLICSSKNDTKSNSIADWHTFYEIILPFLRYIINGLKSWKFQADTLNISEIFLKFREDFWHAWSQYSSRLLEAYQYFFLKKTNTGDVSLVLPGMIEILESIGNGITQTNNAKKNGCAILIRRSKDFFAGPEWKQLAKAL